MASSNPGISATVIMASAYLAGVMLVGCSSTPEPQPEPSKQEIRQDSDRFFQKMGQEEGKQSPSP
jgi:hypothetical protein